MKQLFLGVLTVLAVGCSANLWADSIVTSAVCNTEVDNGTYSNSGTSSCSVSQVPPDTGFATGSVTVNLTPLSGPSFSVGYTAQAEASVPFDPVTRDQGTSSAVINGTTDLTFYTLGSGSGQIVPFIDGAISDFNGQDLVHLSLNGVESTCGGASGACSGALGATGEPDVRIPITLGQPIALHEDLYLAADADYFYGGDNDGGQISLSFGVIDSNGNPVDLYFVPEPGTIALLGLGLAAALFPKPRKKNA